MKINLEILSASYIYSKDKILNLNEKELIKDAMLRRRLTRSSKIVIYLADKIGYQNSDKIIYGNAYGEVIPTTSILNSFLNNTTLSPTSFQNSVHNTAPSYLSILSKNSSEIVTISDLDNTSLNSLKVGAIKSLSTQEPISIMVVDALNFPNVNELNRCIDYLEVGVGLRMKQSKKEANIKIEGIKYSGFSNSIQHILEIAKKVEKIDNPIVEVEV